MGLLEPSETAEPERVQGQAEKLGVPPGDILLRVGATTLHEDISQSEVVSLIKSIARPFTIRFRLGHEN